MSKLENTLRRQNIPEEMRSILALVHDSGILLRAAEQLGESYWNMSDYDLTYFRHPTEVAIAFRGAFWVAVTAALGQKGGKVSLRRIYKIVGCSYSRIQQILTTDPFLTAWILRRPQLYEDQIAPIMTTLLDRVAEIARLPITDCRGRPVARNGRLVLRATEILRALRPAA